MNVLSNQDILTRLLAAAILGSIIGFERERLLWAAGIRTHMVVCVGACLIMIVSAFGFKDSLSSQNVVLDPSRVAAQVVSGIGFLGAGAILARGEIVRGSRRRQASGLSRQSGLRSVVASILRQVSRLRLLLSFLLA
jgi:putative Mg2+ transporter-C (MgtC) family protein